MKNFKKILFICLLALIVFTLVACNGGGGGSSDPTTKTDDSVDPQGFSSKTSKVNGRTVTGLIPKTDITPLQSLTNYGKSEASYKPKATAYDVSDKFNYANKDATEQYNALQSRINQKHQDVVDGKSDSSFIKIFAQSTPEGLLEAMAKASLTFDEMKKVVAYLSGSVDADITEYIEETNNGWTGVFADGTSTWRSKKTANGYFNAGWSFFDDWEMYDKLKEYAKSLKDSEDEAKKDLADDNASWQYRSILEKVYTQVGLKGDAAARLATYMLNYAIDVVKGASGGDIADAVRGSGTNISFGKFGEYCRNTPNAVDNFSGLADYDTLSYLLAFNEYYEGGKGLANCVTLYGYYYNYNETYYKECLADEDTYAKQLKYEKQKTFLESEWLDYVSIQRRNYIKSYRYSDSFYRDFYSYHFNFQGKIEDKDDLVYEKASAKNTIKVNSGIEMSTVGTSYTQEMRKAITKSGSIDGIIGQLALSDWMWAYSGYKPNMIEYNAANTDYENAKDTEQAKEIQKEKEFYFKMQQLYLINFLLEKMVATELSSALYYQVYAYSASMVKNMDTDVKEIVYIADDIISYRHPDKGSEYYTCIPASIEDNSRDQYAQEKIATIYRQTFTSWSNQDCASLGTKANSQKWGTMKTEIESAINYDYMNMTVDSDSTKWEERCQRMEDLVIVRVWSCCSQKVHLDDGTCFSHHTVDREGKKAVKNYDTEHQISVFVSDYEQVLYHIAGKSTVSFQKPEEGKVYATKTTDTTKTWNAGYTGDISALRAQGFADSVIDYSSDDEQKYTISSGDTFKEASKDFDSDESSWWVNNKDNGKDVKVATYEKDEGTSSPITYVYSYEFAGWYLDKNCKYEFDENDEVGVNIIAYAGYNITKRRK